jgi:hypothetical protein
VPPILIIAIIIIAIIAANGFLIDQLQHRGINWSNLSPMPDGSQLVRQPACAGMTRSRKQAGEDCCCRFHRLCPSADILPLPNPNQFKAGRDCKVLKTRHCTVLPTSPPIPPRPEIPKFNPGAFYAAFL